jgi:hypothetical protein
MSDYFFYDLNKKMADLANKQQLAETAQATPVKPAPNRLMEAAADYSAKKAAAGKDIGKPGKNFSKIAADAGKRYGSAEAGKRVAGAVLNKLRHPVNEGHCSKCDCNPCECDSMDESALQAAFGKKKYGDQGMKALQKAGRDHASDSTMKKIRNQYDKYDESQGATDEGNAFSGAVVKAKRDGIQPGEKITVGGKQYELKEVDATPSKRPDPNVPGSMIVVGKDTGPLPKRKTPTSAPDDEDGSTAPPAKGPDGRYPIVTDGPNKGKRWSPATPGPTRAGMKTGNQSKVPQSAINAANASDDPIRTLNKSQKFTSDMKEAAKYRDSKYKDRLYTQEPPDYTFGPDMDDAYDNPKPDDYAGRKRPIGGGSDPLTRGFRMSADKSINTHGKRKGMPSRDQITSLKGSIKDVLGKHTEPNLPEGGVPMSPKQKKFAALAKPFDKITFADKIVGAKKEVDEMLGDVAATAMKKAVRGRNRDMEESFLDDEPTSRRSSSGGRIDTSEPGVTRHRAVKGNYSGAGHDAGVDDEPSGQIGRRKVGAGQGKKIGAKINRGTSKLMTDEGDMPEDMIEPQDSGEYDREGDMAKDTIKTVVRHAQALEKILGDDDNLPEWVQSKLAKIENMMTAVDDYMQNQNDDDMPMEQERTRKRDNRAERAGRKVAKDIEYDEKKKDGIHGQRRGSEDSRAERAGRRVTKDIEYDEKKNKKKKEVDETTTSGSVATGAAPKSGGGHNYGKGIYDSLNRQLENMISESMNINMSMNNDDHGGPRQSLTVTATDDDAVMLASLLKMAGMGHGDEHIHAMTGDDSDMHAIHDMDQEEACSSCGSSPCGCDDEMMDEDRWGAEQPPKLPNDMSVTADGGIDVKKSGSDWVYKSKEPGGRVTVTIPASASNKMLPKTDVDEAYGDTDASENDPDYPTDEVGTADEGMYSGGLNGPKSTGQTTTPVNAGQKDRMGYEGDNDLRRMMEIAGLR